MELLKHNVYIEGLYRAIAIIIVLITTLTMGRIMKKKSRKNENFMKGDETRIKFFMHFVVGIIYFFGILLAFYIVPAFRTLAASLFAGSGVLALIIGFASQHAFANIVSGIFIALFKPFSIGDRIKLIGKEIVGVVEDITLRHTIVRTFENKRIIIPNSVISTDIIENANIIEEKTCKFFEVGISYDSDINKAISIIRNAVIRHPDYYDNRTFEEKEENVDLVTIRVMGFGDSSVNLRAWVWGKDAPTVFKIVCDLNKTVKEEFDKEGIEIPYPYRTVVFKDNKIGKRISEKSLKE
ncbi:MAG: mechanosensitive ion channel protein MscS [Omnitrophica WOR_2 bacterium GWF2_38_59]|nr:MAG: mechanosensitive ion channel protein MscS [Omnitrophica WOR_2 bacterium GWF2_38_59]OGX47254.1 MAG: mechanosensitive ion channel protein MscS [Omnitrophica WOR_2 bacterium RIFOXYA2_FULL_38_17]OGX50978.1 MAG: mechanosensitive ion channel protein MscS [Omnitrophica WOR_2 bacterium RIFOXYA12_FULL_38_10]OGX55127.1 MAG: mechanosensitive ion channel protein MscS [Omnitrophica WOR_2 bacterium RIFOXYC2_FULL_38_12]OGX58048.1 MAG: mechanosensitive ion channel protein MscS [Omnitrophica WOR_2 bacte